MNVKVTLIMVVIAVLVLTVVMYQTVYKQNTQGRSQDASSRAGSDRTNLRLLDPEAYHPDGIHSINLLYSDGRAYEFHYADQMWLQNKPIEFQMQTWMIRKLITTGADLQVSETIQLSELENDELTLEDLLLEPPAATITYISDNAQEVTIYIGRSGIAGRGYVRLDAAGPVYVVGDDLHKRVLESDPLMWRDDTIFTGLDDRLYSIRIQRGEDMNGSDATQLGESIVLRRINQTWRMLEPINTHIDNEAVDIFTRHLAEAKIDGYVCDDVEDLKLYGLIPAHATIELASSIIIDDGSNSDLAHILYLGLPVNLGGQAVYAMRGEHGSVFTVGAALVNRLHPAIDSLISKQVFDIDATDIRSITLDGSGDALQFSRTAESWSLATHEAPAFVPDEARVASLLELITTPLDGIFIGSMQPEDFIATVSVQSFRSAADDAFIAQIGASDAADVFRILVDTGDGVIRYSTNHSIPGLSKSDYIVSLPHSNSDGSNEPYYGAGDASEEPTK